MAAIPKIEYNYYIFNPTLTDSTAKKYQILEMSFYRYQLKCNDETFIDKFPLGDYAVLNLYSVAYAVSQVVCILAALTMGGWFLFSGWTIVKAIIALAITSRFIGYLDQHLMEKSFEIASKVICTHENRKCLFHRSEYKITQAVGLLSQTGTG